MYANVRVGTKSLKQYPSIFLTGWYWNIIRVHLIVKKNAQKHNKKQQYSIANPMMNRLYDCDWPISDLTNQIHVSHLLSVRSQEEKTSSSIWNYITTRSPILASCQIPSGNMVHSGSCLTGSQSDRLPSSYGLGLPPPPSPPDLWVIPIHLSPFTSPRFIQNYPC